MTSYAEFLANRDKVNENLDPEIQAEIQGIALTIQAKGWKLNNKVTKKSMAEIEALGLTEYAQGYPQEIITAIISAATDNGGKRIFDRGAGDAGDDSAVWYTEPSKLYALLNPVEQAVLEDSEDVNATTSKKIEKFLKYGGMLSFSGAYQWAQVVKTWQTEYDEDGDPYSVDVYRLEIGEQVFPAHTIKTFQPNDESLLESEIRQIANLRHWTWA